MYHSRVMKYNKKRDQLMTKKKRENTITLCELIIGSRRRLHLTVVKHQAHQTPTLPRFPSNPRKPLQSQPGAGGPPPQLRSAAWFSPIPSVRRRLVVFPPPCDRPAPRVPATATMLVLADDVVTGEASGRRCPLARRAVCRRPPRRRPEQYTLL